jgi:hypothetical protein
MFRKLLAHLPEDGQVIPETYRDFFSGEVQQIQLRIEGRENGDLDAVAP